MPPFGGILRKQTTGDEPMSEKKADMGQLLTMPVVPLRGMTILPDAVIHFDLNREKSVQALENAMVKGGRLFLVTQKNPDVDNPGEGDLCPVGTISVVKQITKLPKIGRAHV